MPLFGGSGITPSLNGLTTNFLSLAAGQALKITPANWYNVRPGKYSVYQVWDPILNAWRSVGGSDPAASPSFVYNDANNYRIANLTGCTVGALLTNAGSGYTSAPTVTASAGGSIWRAIVGGAISTSATISNGGQNYTYPPAILIAPPAPGGIQATATVTLSGGAINAVTITNQGAGYTSPPSVVIVPDSREGHNGVTQGYGASIVLSLTGSGTVTGLICVDFGTPLTAVPTLTFSGGGGSSAAATAIMCWAITAYAAGTAGAGLSGTVAEISAMDAFPTTAAAYVNPSTQSGLVKVRQAIIKAPISGGGITAAGQVIYDGGIYTSVPTPLVIPTASVVTTAPVVTFTMGGLSDDCLVLNY